MTSQLFKELNQFIANHQYVAQWKDLGALLGLNNYDITNIASDYHNQWRGCM